MSMEYLEELSNSIEMGIPYFACSGSKQNEWHISRSKKDIEQKAQRQANSSAQTVIVFRLVAKGEASGKDSYLIVRKILEVGPRGEPNLLWSLVDTRDAAETVRDVSQGPTPYFGAVEEQQFKAEVEAAK